jgi:ATP-binding protein involved in chromosome partitioning
VDNLTEESVLEALRRVQDPELHRDIVSLGMVKNLAVDHGQVKFTVELTTPACPLRETIEHDCKQALAQVPGISGLEISFGAQVRGSKAGAGQTD